MKYNIGILFLAYKAAFFPHEIVTFNKLIVTIRLL